MFSSSSIILLLRYVRSCFLSLFVFRRGLLRQRYFIETSLCSGFLFAFLSFVYFSCLCFHALPDFSLYFLLSFFISFFLFVYSFILLCLLAFVFYSSFLSLIFFVLFSFLSLIFPSFVFSFFPI